MLFIRSLFCLAGLFSICLSSLLVAENKKPNVIVFLVDDYDKYETSVYGGKALTPNLDRMAREGMIFHHAHVTSTVCTPSRYTFLTGRYAGSSYCKKYLDLFPKGLQASPGFNVELEPDNMNVGGVFSNNGYATGFVGKYHVGPDVSDKSLQRKYGLVDDPKNVTFSEEVNRMKFSNEKGYRKMVMERGFTWVKNLYWSNTKSPFQYHNPEWTIAAAVEFLELHKDKPFYLHYCTTLLHGPNGQWLKSLDFPKVTGEGIIGQELGVMPPRKSVMERISKAGLTENEAGYLWMDDSLGVLLDKLEELGIAENTLVLFTADHGSGNKGSLYKEKGTEVPCLIRWPAQVPAGIRCDELIQNTDFVPTWFDVAGIHPPDDYKMDGTSIAPLFEKPDAPVRSHVYAELGAARSVKTKQFSYLALRYTKEQVEGVRKRERSYLREVSGLDGGASSRAVLGNPDALSFDQLYDLRLKAESRVNLAGKNLHSSTLESMKSTLAAELRRFPNRPYGEFVPGGNAMPGTGYEDVFEIMRNYGNENKKKGKKK